MQSTAILIDHLECKPGQSILEIGFGTGATLVELASRFPEVRLFGLELSNTMFETARERFNYCHVSEKIQTFLTKENIDFFQENQFDTIYLESVLGIQNEEGLKHILQNIRKWLKPNGKLICNETVWLTHVSKEEIDRINQLCLEHFGIIQANAEFPNPNHWLELFTSFDFKVLHTSPIEKEQPTFRFEQNKRSKRFTQKGKINAKFDWKRRKEWKAYQASMNSILPTDSKLMEGWLFKLENQKKK